MAELRSIVSDALAWSN